MAEICFMLANKYKLFHTENLKDFMIIKTKSAIVKINNNN